MTISYNWLAEYLPVQLEPRRLSEILTSIGLEVESMENYESIRGGLKGLVVGEVVSLEKHPNADKLKVSKVNTGDKELLQIVCGASNVAVGQKVVVATVGTTIFPANGQPITMKVANIRDVKSEGMICAEDEVGISENHEGILVLSPDARPGMAAPEYFKPYTDIIYEIGLTPNRMDAMSHLGVARDVCAYLAHHENKQVKVKVPFADEFTVDENTLPVKIAIKNTKACQRYAGVSIKGVTIAPSPAWLQTRLKAIGLRPINNIVDVTNFILHETGQPLHAFNADAIKGGQVIVQNLPEGTPFVTLDEKERKLSSGDLMICNAEEPMCIAGVFGGLHSGVNENTTNIFLESAWFNPTDIRKTSFRHNLRTDAASRFEKGVDISNTVNVLKRAALMIKDIAGGTIASGIIDVYPEPQPKKEVTLQYSYLKKLTGKHYDRSTVRNILEALGFEMIKDESGEIRVNVPYSKTDISLPADIVEEILRIDGFDNVQIPKAITITPSVEDTKKFAYKEKIATHLMGAGFNEILTNSITNSAYFTDEVLQTTVKMINSLSAGLNVMRPSMLETGLQAVAFNINRRNTNLQFYEFGTTYHTAGIGKYEEREHLCLFTTGNRNEDSWRNKGPKADFYFLKGIMTAIFELLGLPFPGLKPVESTFLQPGLQALLDGRPVMQAGLVSGKTRERFDIKQPVLFADVLWGPLVETASQKTVQFIELPRQLGVHRDLALVVPRNLPYETVEKTIYKTNVDKLLGIRLFDVFESEKLGEGKKSMALSFTFLDEEKTLNDKEIDSMMQKIMTALEIELQAEIRKA